MPAILQPSSMLLAANIKGMEYFCLLVNLHGLHESALFEEIMDTSPSSGLAGPEP
jgi:hypothetical protein